MKFFTYILIFTLSLYADVDAEKHLSRISKQVSDLIFPNEKIIEQHYGDLNHDNMKDVVLIVEETNPSKIIIEKNSGYTITKNYNNRHLIIAFKDNKGAYRVQCVNAKGFIPPLSDRDNDNLMVETSIAITTKGILQVNFGTMMSAGGWGATTSVFSFRFQQNDFHLIGSENSSWSRGSGEGSNVSINYLTSEKITTTGLVVVGDADEHPVYKKTKLPRTPLIKLSSMGYFDDYSEYVDY